MAKKIFISVFLFALCACSKLAENTSQDSTTEHDNYAINFTALTSKAISYDIDTLQKDANGFVVYGLQDNSEEWYYFLSGSKYIYNLTSQTWSWEQNNTPYWPESFSYMNFYALYPASAPRLTILDANTSALTAEIEVESSILDQSDYLAANTGVITTRPSSGATNLTFTHIMSRISFSVLQNQGVLTVIRQLGVENVISKGTYDYINSQWQNLSSENIASFSDYVGSSGPFAKYGVADQVDPIRIDNHYLMLIPQKADVQTSLWDGTVTADENGEATPQGAYISIRYRTSEENDTVDVVGYAHRTDCASETQWDANSHFYPIYKIGGSYTGPLYVKASFIFSSENLDWSPGVGYNYTLPLDKNGGILLSEYYHDVDGNNTKIRVDSSPNVGDEVYSTDINIGISVELWNYSSQRIYIP